MTRAESGFTLVELIVVMVIIGILASLIMVNVVGVRQRARDGQRLADLKQLQNALQLYYNDNNRYPVTGLGVWYSSEPGDNQAVATVPPDTDNNPNTRDWIPGLTPTYIKALPRDPRGGISLMPGCAAGGWKSAYHYTSIDGSSYALVANCSPEGSWDSTHRFFDPQRQTWAWKVCSDDPGCTW